MEVRSSDWSGGILCDLDFTANDVVIFKHQNNQIAVGSMCLDELRDQRIT